jgi:hypothetical protein
MQQELDAKLLEAIRNNEDVGQIAHLLESGADPNAVLKVRSFRIAFLPSERQNWYHYRFDGCYNVSSS